MNIKLKDITGNPANPRTIRDKAFQDLKRSIAQFPQMLEKRPIAVIKDAGKWVAIGGNQRTKALIDLQRDIQEGDFADRYKAEPEAVALLTGYFAKGVPCVDCTDLTADQQRRFIIADNLPFGEWDTDALANEWDVDDLQEWGMPDFVFGGADINSDNYGTGFSLPDGDKEPFQQMTFTLADNQAEQIKTAIEDIKKTEAYKFCETFGNENSNGNSLFLIIQQWAEQRR